MAIDINGQSRAAERFQIIAPLLDTSLDKDAVVALRKATAKQYGVDERTLRRWVNSYEQDGFAGLVPAKRKPAENKVIDDDILNAAIQLRRELPKRSVKNIIKCLEAKGIVAEGVVKRSTLQEALSAAGYSSAQMRSFNTDAEERYARRFQKEHRNECWQMDIKYGPYIDGQRTYLFAIIDDATRYICHSEFFFRQDLEAAMTTLRKAFVATGLPKTLYLDNGKVFRSNQMQYIAGRLGIRLTYIKPYTPCGHGKVERFNNTVEGFLLETSLEKIESLEKLNRFYVAWLADCYQNAVHSALDGRTPAEAFENDPEPLRYADGNDLHDAFLRVETRKVNKTGCISLFNEQWEVEHGTLLIGRKVQVLIDPEKPDEVGIECENFVPGIARKLVIQPHTGRKPQVVPPKTDNANSEGSALLRAALEHHEQLEAQKRTEVLRFSALPKD